MAVEKTINLKLNAGEAITDLKRVRGEIDITYAELRRTTPIELDGSKAKTELKDVSRSIKKTAKDAKTIGKGAQESVGGFKNLGEGAKDASGGFLKLKMSTQAFGLALKATGIGLIVAAFVKLQEALGKNQVVMDAFNVVTETISITFQDLVNKLVKATQIAVKFFSKVGGVIKKFLKKDLDGLNSSYEENNEQVETSIQKNRRLAKELVSLRKEVKLAEAEQRLLQLTYQKEAELQRQIRDDVSKTFDERIAANKELGRILDEQFAEEKKIADKRLLLAEKELAKNKENIDLQVAVINAKTELADLDERITGQRSEQLVNLTALQNEYNESVRQFGTLQHKTIELGEDFHEKEMEQMEEHFKQNRLLPQEETEEEESEFDKRLELTKGYYDSVNKITSHFFKEGSAAAKAMALSGILIDTAKGIAGAISAGAGIPFPGNLAAIATGVSTVMAGIANARQIFAKTGGGGGSGGGSVDVSTPRSGIGGDLIPNIEGVTGAISTATAGSPLQAYVVENDISSSQALQQELEEQATL